MAKPASPSRRASLPGTAGPGTPAARLVAGASGPRPHNLATSALRQDVADLRIDGSEDGLEALDNGLRDVVAGSGASRPTR